MRYVQRMNRDRATQLAREYWFELLIGALLISALLELVIQDDSPGAPPSSLWFGVPALALAVCPLFARRNFPFAAPAAYWLTRNRDLVRGRPADPVHGRALPGRAGVGLSTREPERCQARVGRACDRARRDHDDRLQHPRPRTRRDHLHPSRLRHRLGGRFRAPRAVGAGGGGGAHARRRPNGSARRPPASLSPRNGRGSLASSTTSSPTRSA